MTASGWDDRARPVLATRTGDAVFGVVTAGMGDGVSLEATVGPVLVGFTAARDAEIGVFVARTCVGT